MKFSGLMKKSQLSAAVLCICSSALFSAPQNQGYGQQQPDATRPQYAQEKKGNLNIGIVNFKTCIEKSKLGKQEQASFEGMKKQMESILGDKEKEINELANKLNDPDYLDSLTAEAETELKRKFRAQSQEITQQQQQYYQTLQQANYKILQKLSDIISKASAEVAREDRLDLIINEEGTFYYGPSLDVSMKVVAKMDSISDREAREQHAAPQTFQGQ